MNHEEQSIDGDGVLDQLKSADAAMRRAAAEQVYDLFERRVLRFLASRLHQRLRTKTSPESLAQSVWASFLESADARPMDEATLPELLSRLLTRCKGHMVDAAKYHFAQKRGGGKLANTTSVEPSDGEAARTQTILEVGQSLNGSPRVSKSPTRRQSLDSGSPLDWNPEHVDAFAELLDHCEPSAKLVVDEFLGDLDEEQTTVLKGMLEDKSDETIAKELGKSAGSVQRKRKRLQRKAHELLGAKDHGYSED